MLEAYSDHARTATPTGAGGRVGTFPQAHADGVPSEPHQPACGSRCRKAIARNTSSDRPSTYAALLQRSPLCLRLHTYVVFLEPPQGFASRLDVL